MLLEEEEVGLESLWPRPMVEYLTDLLLQLLSDPATEHDGESLEMLLRRMPPDGAAVDPTQFTAGGVVGDATEAEVGEFKMVSSR